MNFRKLLFASTLISLVLTACGGGTPTTQPTLPEPEVNTTQATSTPLAQVTFPLTITDGLQRTITLETPAQRII